MKPCIRAAAAAVALAHSLGRLVTRVYEQETSAYNRISVCVRNGRVSGYDYISHCYVDGELANVYHHGEDSHFTLMPNGSGTYNGFDHDTFSHFSVKVERGEAHMFDYNEDSYFAYSV